jgi:hypothetical protein
MISLGAETHWAPIEVLAAYERVRAEVQVIGKIKLILDDPEPELLPLRHVSVTPLVPGVHRFQDVPEAALNKAFMGVVVPLQQEPISPDEIVERVKRHVLIQGETFTVQGIAEFSAVVDPGFHRDLLVKNRFFPVIQASIGLVGPGEFPTWEASLAYVNRDLIVGLFLS